MSNGYVDMWNNWSLKRSGIPVYDKWLDNYKEILEKYKDSEILDLGCGLGANSLYLSELGYKVAAADFASNALDNINKNIPSVKTLFLNMMDKFPLEDDSFNVVIADLSLHYFDDKVTRHIMKEIKRILKDDGVLLARVARVDDTNFGAMEGEELEHHYFFEGAYTKRFFDDEDIVNYFSLVGNVTFCKTDMLRDEEEYSKVKRLYEVKVVKTKSEYLDVVDENDERTGEVLEREEIHSRNLLHDEVAIFVVNKQHEILLQKRSMSKRYSPGKWGLVGGHVVAGESLIKAALRELEEEIGLMVNEDELIPIKDVELCKFETNSHFLHYYYIVTDFDTSKCKYQKEEVDEVKWFRIDEVKDIVNGDNNYTTLTSSKIDILDKLVIE